jgi:glycosyltransferase involved in cell wall biosynthesis
LIHTHQALWESISCGVARPWLSGLPTIIQPASSGFYGEAEEMARTKGFPILRRIAVRNTAFVAISEEIERQWLRLGVPPSRMTRLASGVDTDRFRPGPSTLESSLPARRPRVVFTGRIHLQKNLDILIDIWGNVARETGASLVLVGQGEERPRLEQRVAEMGLNERVVFVGAADDPSEHLRAADLFVLPSVAEGMSNSLLEAMSTGLPCIASEIGGNIDLLGDGAGLLVPPDDRPAWTKALIGSLKDEGLRTRLGRAARAKIEAEFGLSSVVDRYLELYGRLLESPA